MKKRRGCLHSLFVLIAVAIAFAGFWRFENHTIKTEEYLLVSDRLPAAFDGLRIVEIADLHGKEFGENSQDLVAAVRAASPDIITLNGDIADENTDLSMMPPLLTQLCGLAPVYYVTGNHEWAMDARQTFFAMLEEAGVTLLRNEFLQLSKGEDSIILAGVDDPNGPRDKKSPETLVSDIRDLCGEPYILMLSHRNDALSQWSALAVDTVLTGHGHGGVIRLPVVGGLIGVNRELFPEYTAGVYESGRTNMVVSRGLGNSVVNFRLFNRPHLPVIVLKCGDSPVNIP